MIEKIFNSRKLNYSSNLNEENLKQKIEDLFNQSDLGFVGKFRNQNEFKVYDQWTYITWYIPNFKRKTAYINGQIIKSGNGTLLKLNIKPNPVIAILPIFTVLIGIISIMMAESNIKTLIFGLIIIAIGVLFYLLGMFLTHRIQSNFKKYFELKMVKI
ncbi:MAG TPA: hypothetical protein VLZ83_11130 [Edaphocola sp.]|nr:hypothetical protein [Edaphocola sp.]